MSTFSSWDLVQLNKRFKLKRVIDFPILEEWQNANIDISEMDKILLSKMQPKLKKNIYNWNEEELKMYVIAWILSLIDFSSDAYNIFHDRAMTATVNGEELSGEPDAIIATGIDAPEVPYFCLHEYKKRVMGSGDPIGQCLAAMLAAQELNNYSFPIYGVCVVGENWCFMVLKGNEYAISPSYSAITEDIYKIYQMLLWLKAKIEEYVAEDLAKNS